MEFEVADVERESWRLKRRELYPREEEEEVFLSVGRIEGVSTTAGDMLGVVVVVVVVAVPAAVVMAVVDPELRCGEVLLAT